MLSPTIIAALITVAATVIIGIVGFLYRKRNQRIVQVETASEETEERLGNLEARVDSLWRWAFGREDDATDKGISKEIEEGFENVHDDLQEIEKRQKTYHETEMEQFKQLVNELHDDEDVDVEREDILED